MTKDENATIKDTHLGKTISKTDSTILEVIDRITLNHGTTIEITRHGITTIEVITTIIDDRITTGNRSRLTTITPTNNSRT